MKGSGKGSQQGCWTCGGAHYASNCPSLGKRGSVRHFEESSNPDWAWAPEVKPLCCLSTHVKKAFDDKENWNVVGKPTQKQIKTLRKNAKECTKLESIKEGSVYASGNKYEILNNEESEKDQYEKPETLYEVEEEKMFWQSVEELEDEKKTIKKKELKRILSENKAKEFNNGNQKDIEAKKKPILKTKVTGEIQSLNFTKGNLNKNQVSKVDDKCGQELRIFRTILPEGLNPVTLKGEWEMIELAVDSGATETVVSEDMLKSVETKESWGSKKGVEYEVANGDTIPNLGEKKFHGVTENGITRNLTAQVCEVNKALLSVKKIIAAGNRVVFDEEGSFIEDKSTGERMWMKDEGGMFMLKMWVKS